MTYQWMQVTIGMFYSSVTGVELEAFYQTDWQRIVLEPRKPLRHRMGEAVLF